METLAAGDPRQMGVYRLRARLGAGGMGQVFLGYSPAGRAVAVKVIHRDLARDPEFRTRFRREVAAAGAVSGAYTAPVVAAGRTTIRRGWPRCSFPGLPWPRRSARRGRYPRRRGGGWPEDWSRRCRPSIPAGSFTGT